MSSKNIFKNIIIALLIILTIFQTEKLWLRDISGDNFFYDFLYSSDNFYSSIEKEKHRFSLSEIVINFANDNFYKTFTDHSTEILEDKCFELIKQGFKEASYLEDSDFDKDLYENKSIILQYRIEIPSEDFANAIDEKAGLISQEIDSINQILIIPAKSNSDFIKIYFVNTKKNIEKCFLMANVEALSLELNEKINFWQNINTNINYMSSSQKEFDIFSQKIFLPHWTSEKASYSKLLKLDDYHERIDVYARQFFEKNYDFFLNDNIYTYRDLDGFTVLKFDSDLSTLEYSYYDDSDLENKKISLNEAYTIVSNFILRDEALDNNYYLYKAFENEEGWQFYFNYSTDKYSINLSDELSKKLDMEACIEVTVSNKAVKKYKRLTTKFEKKEEKDYINISFSSALNSFYDKFELNKNEIDDLTLNYIIDNSEEISLFWMLRQGDKKAVINALSE